MGLDEFHDGLFFLLFHGLDGFLVDFHDGVLRCAFLQHFHQLLGQLLLGLLSLLKHQVNFMVALVERRTVIVEAIVDIACHLQCLAWYGNELQLCASLTTEELGLDKIV